MQGMTIIPSNASGVRRICQVMIMEGFAVNSAHLNTMEKTLMSQSYDWC